MSKNLSRVKITDQMESQIHAYIEAQDIPPAQADVVRLALAEFLERNGFPVEVIHPQRGGDWR